MNTTRISELSRRIRNSRAMPFIASILCDHFEKKKIKKSNNNTHAQEQHRRDSCYIAIANHWKINSENIFKSSYFTGCLCWLIYRLFYAFLTIRRAVHRTSKEKKRKEEKKKRSKNRKNVCFDFIFYFFSSVGIICV